MSSTLYWEPVWRKRTSLSDDLKSILHKRYDEPIDAVVNEDDFSYLTALCDAEVDGAEELIKAIKNHGEIQLIEEC